MYLITGLVGVIALIAPFFFGYTGNTAALWTNLLVGAVLVVVTIAEFLAQDREDWEYWVAAVIGLLAIAAPYVLGFEKVNEAYWTAVGVGLVAVLVAGVKLGGKATLT